MLSKEIEIKLQTELLNKKNTIFRDKNCFEINKSKFPIDKNILLNFKPLQ